MKSCILLSLPLRIFLQRFQKEKSYYLFFILTGIKLAPSGRQKAATDSEMWKKKKKKPAIFSFPSGLQTFFSTLSENLKESAPTKYQAYPHVFHLLWSNLIRVSFHSYLPATLLVKMIADLKNPGITEPNLYFYDYPTEYKLAKITF